MDIINVFVCFIKFFFLNLHYVLEVSRTIFVSRAMITVAIHTFFVRSVLTRVMGVISCTMGASGIILAI